MSTRYEIIASSSPTLYLALAELKYKVQKVYTNNVIKYLGGVTICPTSEGYTCAQALEVTDVC